MNPKLCVYVCVLLNCTVIWIIPKENIIGSKHVCVLRAGFLSQLQNLPVLTSGPPPLLLRPQQLATPLKDEASAPVPDQILAKPFQIPNG